MKLVGSLTNKNIREKTGIVNFIVGNLKLMPQSQTLMCEGFFMVINQEKWPEDSPAKYVYSVFIYNEMNAHN